LSARDDQVDLVERGNATLSIEPLRHPAQLDHHSCILYRTVATEFLRFLSVLAALHKFNFTWRLNQQRLGWREPHESLVF
jgi:hypothetical protein